MGIIKAAKDACEVWDHDDSFSRGSNLNKAMAVLRGALAAEAESPLIDSEWLTKAMELAQRYADAVSTFDEINNRDGDSRLNAAVRDAKAGRLALESHLRLALTAKLETTQEPVAWGFPNTAITGKRSALMMVRIDVPSDDQYGGALWIPLYTAPPQRELTDEEIDRIARNVLGDVVNRIVYSEFARKFARAVLAASKEAK